MTHKSTSVLVNRYMEEMIAPFFDEQYLVAPKIVEFTIEDLHQLAKVGLSPPPPFERTILDSLPGSESLYREVRRPGPDQGGRVLPHPGPRPPPRHPYPRPGNARRHPDPLHPSRSPSQFFNDYCMFPLFSSGDPSHFR